MILKVQLSLVLIVAWIYKATCASVSKVYVQSGADALPLEYYQYGSPGLAYNSPQIAQLSGAPINSVVPVSSGYVPPCVAPCVYPGSTIASFAPVPSGANIVSYQSPVPSLPVMAPNWNEPAGYEYAYVVYDQNTGDKKSQSEFSDGSIVRGEYSFIQPDGYVREVQYVADDLTGFNVIVSNHLPVTEEHRKVDKTAVTKPTIPCPEVKSKPIKHTESLNEAETSSEEKHDEIKSKSDHKVFNENHVDDPHNHPHESHEEGIQKSHEGPKGHIVTESHKNIHSIAVPKSTKEVHETKISTIPKSTGTLDDASILVPYKDIMKCIEALLSKATMVRTESPLAYLVLNKPC